MTHINVGRVKLYTGPVPEGGFLSKWEDVSAEKVMGPVIDFGSVLGPRQVVYALPMAYVNWDGMAHILGYRRWSHLKRERATWKPFRRKRHHVLGGRR